MPPARYTPTDTARRIVAIGPSDVGKSTWVRARARSATLRAAIVSGDVGQPLAGPPGAVALLDRPDAPARAPAALRHVGATRPDAAATLELTGAIRTLVGAAERAADRVLVDTDGYVAAPGGRDAKRALLEALAPCTAVLFGRDPALAPLAAWAEARDDIAVERIAPSPGTRRRGRGERRRARRAAFARWLAADQRHALAMDQVLLLGPGSGLGPRLDAGARRRVADTLGFPALHGEWAGQRPALVLDRRIGADARARLAEAFDGRAPRLREARGWLGRTIGDLRGDGLSAGVGLVVGWRLDPPALVVRGRFTAEPGTTWLLGARPG